MHRDIGFGLSQNQGGSEFGRTAGLGGRNGLFGVVVWDQCNGTSPIWRDGIGVGVRVVAASFGAGIRVFYPDALFKNGAWILSHGRAVTGCAAQLTVGYKPTACAFSRVFVC